MDEDRTMLYVVVCERAGGMFHSRTFGTRADARGYAAAEIGRPDTPKVGVYPVPWTDEEASWN